MHTTCDWNWNGTKALVKNYKKGCVPEQRSY
jgi:hypothetical protein